LIASSIGIATGTYAIVIVLFLAAAAALSVQALVRNRFTLQRFANLILSVEAEQYGRIESALNSLMSKQLDNLSLKTMSVMDGRVSLHYQFRKKAILTERGSSRRFISLPGLRRWKSSWAACRRKVFWPGGRLFVA
jgi:hypothetical protein